MDWRGLNADQFPALPGGLWPPALPVVDLVLWQQQTAFAIERSQAGPSF
jgi:hypothetical protein